MADIEIGTAAFDTVTKGVANYLPYVTGLCYAIASIICLAGAMEIYFAYINEAQDVKKRILRVTFACVFFVASAHGLPAFFGLKNSSISSGVLDYWGMIDGNIQFGTDFTGRPIYTVVLPNGQIAIIRPPRPNPNPTLPPILHPIRP